MESSGYISTHEESSKNQTEEELNEPSNRMSNATLPQNIMNRPRAKGSIIPNNVKENINETLPIKKYISTFNFKIVFIGNVAVGKSSIIRRFVLNEYNKQYFCTVGTELSKKSLLIGENKMVNLFIWDTCGQEKFRTVTRQYYRDTQAILLVFDLTDEKSFTDLESWYEEAIDYINDNKCNFFLFGNKCDEVDKIKIKEDKIKNFIKKNSKIKKYFEVSALNGHNIVLSFDKICQYLVMAFGIEEINKNMKTYKMNLEIENKNKEENNDRARCC